MTLSSPDPRLAQVADVKEKAQALPLGIEGPLRELCDVVTSILTQIGPPAP